MADTKTIGKNIHVGMGVSKLEDSYEAAWHAAQEAAQECSEEPTFSIVFCSSKHDPQKVAEGIEKILTGTEWIGCTTDRELNSKTGYTEGSVEVLCISSKYLHFHTIVAENYRDDPFEKGKNAIIEATKMAEPDRLITSYIEYSRHTKKNYTDIVRNPPYFILTLIGGTRYVEGQPQSGKETEFLNGMFNAVGSNIPIVGASCASDFNKFAENIGENYLFWNGKVHSNAAIVTFVVSDLYFSYSLEHGYKITPRTAMLSKVSGNGQIIEEINGNTAVDEYCKIIGVEKEELLRNPFQYVFTNPFGIVDADGNSYVKSMVPNPDGKTFYIPSKLMEKSFVDILSFDEDSVLNALSDAISQSREEHEDKKPAIALIFSCAVRRVLLGDKIKKAVEIATSKHSDISFFGFYSLGEIGSKKDKQSQYNNQTVTVLFIYDKLLTE